MSNTVDFPAGGDLSPEMMTETMEPKPLGERCVYDSGKGSRYWLEEVEGEWIDGNERQMRRWLTAEGLDPFPPKGELRSEVDDMIIETERRRRVEWSGIVAGNKAGVQRMAGASILVSRTVPPLAPMVAPDNAERIEVSQLEGEREWDALVGDCRGWPTLGLYLRGLLSCQRESEDGEKEVFDQRVHFFGWLQRAMRSLHEYKPIRGHAILLAGEPSSGKSLLLALLMELMGGRSANPLRWIEGSTDFNKDIVQAPLLVVDDEGAKTSIVDRKLLAAKVKQIVAVERIRIEGKHADSIQLEPFKRLVMATNLEEQNLLVFPPIDDDIRNKVMLFKAYSTPFPWPENWSERQIWDCLSAELPAFVGWLLGEFELPLELVSQRFGVVEFHHPEILEGIDYLSPENRLLGWIDRTVMRADNTWQGEYLERGIWKGTATDLEVALKDPEGGLSFKERDKVPAANPTLGKYLKTLSEKPHLKGRITQSRMAGTGQRIWTICDTGHLPETTSNGGSVTGEMLIKEGDLE